MTDRSHNGIFQVSSLAIQPVYQTPVSKVSYNRLENCRKIQPRQVTGGLTLYRYQLPAKTAEVTRVCYKILLRLVSWVLQTPEDVQI